MTEEMISENLKRIRFNIAQAIAKYRSDKDSVRLMAVTKTIPYEKVNCVVEQGVELLGENRVQEYLDKKDFYNKNAEVHFIGHLQTNKVRFIAENVSCIHSVDSVRLAEEISRQCAKYNRKMDILAEVNIGGEDSKSGVAPDMLEPLLYDIAQLENVRICGLMTIPPPAESDIYFGRVQELFHKIKDMNIENVRMDTLSMGMSADYEEAIRFGSNIVRIGSALFGAREKREEVQ